MPEGFDSHGCAAIIYSTCKEAKGAERWQDTGFRARQNWIQISTLTTTSYVPLVQFLSLSEHIPSSVKLILIVPYFLWRWNEVKISWGLEGNSQNLEAIISTLNEWSVEWSSSHPVWLLSYCSSLLQHLSVLRTVLKAEMLHAKWRALGKYSVVKFPGPRNVVLFLINLAARLKKKKKEVNRFPCQVFMLLYLTKVRQVWSTKWGLLAQAEQIQLFFSVCWSEPDSEARVHEFEAWLFPFLPGSFLPLLLFYWTGSMSNGLLQGVKETV